MVQRNFQNDVTIQIPANSLYPYLNQAKCIRILQPLIPPGETYSLPLNVNSYFNNDSYNDDGIFENLAHMICEQDSTGLLEWDYTSEGESFIYAEISPDQYSSEDFSVFRERVICAMLTAIRLVCDIADEEFFATLEEAPAA